MKEITVSQSTRLQCDKCYATGSPDFTSVIAIGEAIMVECSQCGERGLLSCHPYPKIEAAEGGDTTRFSMVTDITHKNKRENVTPLDGQPEREDNELTFKQHATEIAQILYEGTQKISSLMEKLRELTKGMTVEFSEAWGMADAVQHWDEGYMNEFITKPFLIFPAETADPVIQPYCIFVAAPKFFTQRYGIPIHCSGGFFLELLSPYTRYSNHRVPEWLLKYIDMPASLELSVVGNKIMGPTLVECWESIPGCTEDDDHTRDMPSIRIQHQMEARTWLAKHGVRPWEPQPITLQDYAMADMPDRISAGVLQSIAKNGRVLLPWWDSGYAREMCVIAALRLPGFKLFISADKTRSFQWKECVGKQGARSNDNYNTMMWHVYDDITDIKMLSEVSCVFVDYGDGDGVSWEFMENLYKHIGPLVVVCDDPVMDTLTTNEEAELLYGLVADVVFHRPADWGTSWRHSKLPDGSMVRTALDKLQQ